ncbi:hypothetical protein L7F22_045155 [Adiantum nelumboides]|nr:hypothetical protein [Adiantum nelumboides]
MNFKEQHHSIDIGICAFQSLKPFFVRKFKERNTCCCVYHTRIDLMRLAINSLRIDTKSIHGDACDYLCMICRPNEEEKCSAYAATFSSVSKLWRSTVCPKEESVEWHKFACLLRTCKQCPKPLFCPRELDVANQELIKWKTFEYVTEDIGNGRTRKRIKQVYKETPAKDIISGFLQHLNVFIPHNFQSYWRNTQFKECLKNLPDNVVMSIVDFAKKYTFKVHNKI